MKKKVLIAIAAVVIGYLFYLTRPTKLNPEIQAFLNKYEQLVKVSATDQQLDRRLRTRIIKIDEIYSKTEVVKSLKFEKIDLLVKEGKGDLKTAMDDAKQKVAQSEPYINKIHKIVSPFLVPAFRHYSDPNTRPCVLRYIGDKSCDKSNLGLKILLFSIDVILLKHAFTDPNFKYYKWYSEQYLKLSRRMIDSYFNFTQRLLAQTYKIFLVETITVIAYAADDPDIRRLARRQLTELSLNVDPHLVTAFELEAYYRIRSVEHSAQNPEKMSVHFGESSWRGHKLLEIALSYRIFRKLLFRPNDSKNLLYEYRLKGSKFKELESGISALGFYHYNPAGRLKLSTGTFGYESLNEAWSKILGRLESYRKTVLEATLRASS